MKIKVNIDQIYNTQNSGPKFLFVYFRGSLRLVQRMLTASIATSNQVHADLGLGNM